LGSWDYRHSPPRPHSALRKAVVTAKCQNIRERPEGGRLSVAWPWDQLKSPLQLRILVFESLGHGANRCVLWPGPWDWSQTHPGPSYCPTSGSWETVGPFWGVPELCFCFFVVKEESWCLCLSLLCLL
jgi:hypothetical protein